jgi:hypothetical protein
VTNRLTYIDSKLSEMEILGQPLCETVFAPPPPLFVTRKGCRSEFQTPPIKSFTSKSSRVIIKVQIHDEIFSCNFGLMIQKFDEQLNFIVETLVRDMKH